MLLFKKGKIDLWIGKSRGKKETQRTTLERTANLKNHTYESVKFHLSRWFSRGKIDSRRCRKTENTLTTMGVFENNVLKKAASPKIFFV